jgi:glycosyltransferase involved in cell wall biosynthesis
MLTPNQSGASVANPLVTMIVLCYNQARFVVETLESVKAQTYKNTELIIIDDCSTDDSVAVIDRWLNENKIQCTFIPHKKNQGICKSLNEALAATTGKYISMIAADDIWLPDKIERQVAIMESQPDSVGVLYSEAFHMDENGRRGEQLLIEMCWNLAEMPQGHVLDVLMRGSFIPGPTTLIRRSCYDKVGLYDEALPWEDWDMWMRMARHYTFMYSPTTSAIYRIHSHSIAHADPIRLAKQMIKVGVKQFRAGDLTRSQSSTLVSTLMKSALELYGRNDPETLDALRTLSQASGDLRAWSTYVLARLGVSHKGWLRANVYRLKLRSAYRLLRRAQ